MPASLHLAAGGDCGEHKESFSKLQPLVSTSFEKKAVGRAVCASHCWEECCYVVYVALLRWERIQRSVTVHVCRHRPTTIHRRVTPHHRARIRRSVPNDCGNCHTNCGLPADLSTDDPLMGVQAMGGQAMGDPLMVMADRPMGVQ